MYQQYNPNYMYSQPLPQPQLQPQQELKQENNGFINVHSEQQARDWPVAPGHSLTFKNESAPYIYTKTMGFSQLDIPVFEKYRFTKEEDPQSQNNQAEFVDAIAAIENELNDIKESYKLLRNEIDEMKNWMRQPFMKEG